MLVSTLPTVVLACFVVPSVDTHGMVICCIAFMGAIDWGTSEWSANEIMQAVAIADRLGLVAPVVEQPEYSLLRRDRVEREYSVVFDSPRGYGGKWARWWLPSYNFPNQMR